MKKDLTNFAATVAVAMGAEPAPTMNQGAPELTERLTAEAGGKIEKIFALHCDAVPAWIVGKYPELFGEVRKYAPLAESFRSVMPSITPVCFAAMFSGNDPEHNGVPGYVPPMITPACVQPSIKGETLMDSLVRAGKKIAVVTCADGCIASMLWNRGEDLYVIPGDDDAAMAQKAEELILNYDYDGIFLYQEDFDHTMHGSGPESEKALRVLKTITDRFGRLAGLFTGRWKEKRVMTVFNADHGCHLTPNGGTHGSDCPEDMEMTWFFGAYPANR